jgi:DNA-binding MarR family transcriptional regulator
MKTKQYDEVAEDLMVFMPLFKGIMSTFVHTGHSPHLKYAVLGILKNRGPLPMSEIGSILGVSKPNMTVIIDKIIEEKDVKRGYDDKDRRIIRIEITKKGKDALADAKELMKSELKKRLSILDDKELDELSSSLKNIKDILSKLSLRHTK